MYRLFILRLITKETRCFIINAFYISSCAFCRNTMGFFSRKRCLSYRFLALLSSVVLYLRVQLLCQHALLVIKHGRQPFPLPLRPQNQKAKKIEASSKNCRRFEASVLYPEPTPLRLDFAGHCNYASLYLLHAGYMLVLRGRECKN